MEPPVTCPKSTPIHKNRLTGIKNSPEKNILILKSKQSGGKKPTIHVTGNFEGRSAPGGRYSPSESSDLQARLEDT